jgi:hypothetical protein
MKTRINPNDEKIVKCACGLTMRNKDWRVHWYGCRHGSSVPVTPDDIHALLDSEKRKQEAAAEHQQWLEKRHKQVQDARTDGRVSW